MPRDHDEIFARAAIQLRVLTPEQVMACRAALERAEAAGRTPMLAAVAVAGGCLSRDIAQKVIDAINRKLPGQHPPFTLEAPVEAAAAPAKTMARAAPGGAQAPSRLRPRAAPSRSRLQPPRARPSRGKVVAAIVGGAGLLGVVAVLAVALGGRPKKSPVSESTTALKQGEETPRPLKTPEPIPAPPATAEKPAPPAPVPSKVEGPAPSKVEGPPPPPSESKTDSKPADAAPAKPGPSEGQDREFRARLAEARLQARERLDEAKREISQERKQAEEQAEALRRRLSARTVTLTLKSGETYKDAQIRQFTLHEADIESGGRPARVAWESVSPGSLLSAADVIYDPKSAREQFDRGRFFVARRSWKEAQEAFERAAKLGEGYESRVGEFREILDRLVAGTGVFNGHARKVGFDALLVTYDFQAPKQLEDFTRGLALSGKSAVLESKERADAVLRGGSEEGASPTPLMFVSEMSVDARVAADAGVIFGLFVGPHGGYELELDPQGLSLFRVDRDKPPKDRRTPVARNDAVKLSPGKTHHVRLHTRQWKFTVVVDELEPAVFEDRPSSADDPPPHGLFHLAIPRGKLRIDPPLAIQGRLEPAELEKRLGHTEVFVRRALDPEFEEIRGRLEREMALGMLEGGEGIKLSADDLHFTSGVKNLNTFLEKYDELKKELGGYFKGRLPPDFTLAKWQQGVSELIAAAPDVPALYYLRALSHEERQNPVAARADLKRALELFPEFHEALAREAKSRLDEFDLDGALKTVNRALDARPDYAHAYVVRALTTFMRSPTAAESFTEDLHIARKLDPNSSEAGHYLRVITRQVKGPRDLGCRFDQETEHYRITTDISAEAARRYGEALEAAWAHFASTFKDLAPRKARRKPRVAIFNTAENYYTYFELMSETRGTHTLGVYRSAFNELVLFETLDLDHTYHTLFHEAFHHFMDLLVSEHAPYWYNEGIAEYMGGITVKGGKIVKKAVVLFDRHFVIRWTVEVNSTIPFPQIMVESPREFYGSQQSLKYAQSWSMVHFFYEYQGGKYRPLMDRYLQAIRAHKSPQEAYESVFAPQVTTLESEWKEYVKKLKP